MPKLTQVNTLPGYKLHLVYEDGASGDVDLTHLVGKGVFQLWDDPNAFEKAAIGTGGEFRWSDEVDLCADALYLQVTGKQLEELFPNLSKTSSHA